MDNLSFCFVFGTHRWLQPHAIFMFSKHSTKTKRRINGRATHMGCVQIGRFLCAINADRNFTCR